jgi:hypothetical protein
MPGMFHDMFVYLSGMRPVCFTIMGAGLCRAPTSIFCVTIPSDWAAVSWPLVFLGFFFLSTKDRIDTRLQPTSKRQDDHSPFLFHMSAKRNVAVMGAGKIGSCISSLLLVSALLSSTALLETPGAKLRNPLAHCAILRD